MNKFLILILMMISISLSGQFQHKEKAEEGPKGISSRENIEVEKPLKQSFVEKNTEYQRNLRELISQNLREFKSNRNSKVIFLSLFLAFLYGVVHSLGPGHGKVFLVSQVIGSEVKFRTVVGSSVFFAFLHSLSGLTLVVVLRLLSMKILQDSTKFSMIAQKASFVIIIGLGVFILVKALLNKSDEHVHHKFNNLYLTALMIGFVPCPGSIIISVFAMRMGTYTLGLFMILAMSIGMATTLIVLNGITLYYKSLTTRVIGNKDNIKNISRIMTIIGSVLLILLGTMFLLFYSNNL
ncbi:hypothetical protein JEZ13_05555 [bacterium]|nr:hypothetical protein [bacterium]